MERSRTWQLRASEASVANSTALAFSTGKRPRQPQADRADVGVRRRAEVIGATAKGLGGGEQLHVDFEPDHGLVLGQNIGRERGGRHIELILAREGCSYSDVD